MPMRHMFGAQREQDKDLYCPIDLFLVKSIALARGAPQEASTAV